jgi:hypothetical protein
VVCVRIPALVQEVSELGAVEAQARTRCHRRQLRRKKRQGTPVKIEVEIQCRPVRTHEERMTTLEKASL